MMNFHTLGFYSLASSKRTVVVFATLSSVTLSSSTFGVQSTSTNVQRYSQTIWKRLEANLMKVNSSLCASSNRCFNLRNNSSFNSYHCVQGIPTTWKYSLNWTRVQNVLWKILKDPNESRVTSRANLVSINSWNIKQNFFSPTLVIRTVTESIKLMKLIYKTDST